MVPKIIKIQYKPMLGKIFSEKSHDLLPEAINPIKKTESHYKDANQEVQIFPKVSVLNLLLSPNLEHFYPFLSQFQRPSNSKAENLPQAHKKMNEDQKYFLVRQKTKYYSAHERVDPRYKGKQLEEQKNIWSGENQYQLIKGRESQLLKNKINKNYQFIEVQKNVSEFKLEEMKKRGNKFSDQSFPPNEKSLTGVYGSKPSWKVIKWRKISEICPNSLIFRKKINPFTIKQGAMGDCYLLAGISAISEKYQRILRLFLLKYKNQYSYYSIKILYRGKWKIIDLDEYIPSIRRRPAFGHSVVDELWVILLEKAWAKLYGSYRHIEAGYAQQSLHDLTGAPIKQIFINKLKYKEGQIEEIWQYLVEASEKEYAMVASSNQKGKNLEKTKQGIFLGHAYSLLLVSDIDTGYKKQRIVKLRNPWGKHQFNGKWSDFDSNWNYISEAEKRRLQFKLDINDGLFFMSFEDFIRDFHRITVAQINDEASYIYKSYYDPEAKGAYFRIDIKQAGKYSLQVHKTPERAYRGEIQKKYKYPEAFIELANVSVSPIKKFPGFRSFRRTLYRYYDLDPGIYIVWVKVAFDEKFQKDYHVTLSIYSQSLCQIRIASKDQAVKFRMGKETNWKGFQNSEKFVQKPKAELQIINTSISLQEIHASSKLSTPRVKKIRRIQYTTKSTEIIISYTKNTNKKIQSKQVESQKSCFRQIRNSSSYIQQKKLRNYQKNNLIVEKMGQRVSQKEKFKQRIEKEVNTDKKSSKIISQNKGGFTIDQESGEEQSQSDIFKEKINFDKKPQIKAFNIQDPRASQDSENSSDQSEQEKQRKVNQIIDRILKQNNQKSNEIWLQDSQQQKDNEYDF